jgi:hypothetical protein
MKIAFAIPRPPRLSHDVALFFKKYLAAIRISLSLPPDFKTAGALENRMPPGDTLRSVLFFVNGAANVNNEVDSKWKKVKEKVCG